MELINQYLIQNFLILIPIYIILSKVFKSIPKIQDWTVTFIVLSIVVILAVLLGASLKISPVSSIIQGILVSGAAVYGRHIGGCAARGVTNMMIDKRTQDGKDE